jgi:hypothetical protein
LLVDPGICSTATNWVEKTIVDFFAALRQPVPANLPGAIVVSIWNWLVDAGEAFVHDIIKAASDAVLGTIRIMAAGLSAAAMQIASLRPYEIKVAATGDNGGVRGHNEHRHRDARAAGRRATWRRRLDGRARVHGIGRTR